MEKIAILPTLLRYTLFSLSVFVFSECKYPTNTVDFYFYNYQNQNAEVTIYSANTEFQKDYKTVYLVLPNDSVKIGSATTEDDRSGVDVCGFIERVDSVCIKMGDHSNCDIVWRKSGNHTISAGFEFAHDWYDCDLWTREVKHSPKYDYSRRGYVLGDAE